MACAFLDEMDAIVLRHLPLGGAEDEEELQRCFLNLHQIYFIERSTTNDLMFRLLRNLVIDDGHLSLPFLPDIIFSDQVCHKVPNIDTAGLSRIKDRTSNW